MPKKKETDNEICSHLIPRVKIKHYRPLWFCNAFRDEGCCGGVDYSCPFYTTTKVNIVWPNRIEVHGAIYGPKRKGW